MNRPDWSSTSTDYARHRKGFPPRFFTELVRRGVVARGARIVDLGTGTGSVAMGLAEWGAEVIGVDVARGQVRAATAAARARGLSVDFRLAAAERTGLDDGAFDAVVAGQCWHWLDRPAAAVEVMRLLREGGHVVIAHFDWLELPDSVPRATVALAEQHLGTIADDVTKHSVDAFYPAWLSDLDAAGFVEIETFSFDVDVRYTHEGWRGRMRASAWIGASLSADRIAAFDRDLAETLTSFSDPVDVPHRVFAVHARKR